MRQRMMDLLWRVWALALLVYVVACASPATTRDTPVVGGEPPPRFAARGPDAEAFGASMDYPVGTRATFWRTRWSVGSFSHLDEIFRGRLIHKAPTPSRLVRVAEPHVSWAFEGADLTLDDYLSRNPTTGLLIARGDTILVERYQYGRTDRDRFTSWSMAKTVTAMLVGIAIGEGRIRSVDDLAAAYVPELAGTEYGRTSLRHLLQMSSGVRFNEDFSSPRFFPDDAFQLFLDTYGRLGPGGVGAVTSFNDRERPAGTKFSYASAETQVLGLVLARAIGKAVAEYLEQKIWGLMGGRRHMAHRQLRSGGHVLLPERCAARPRAPRATVGARRQLARAPDHPVRVGSGCNHQALGRVGRNGHANHGLRLPDLGPARRAKNVHALGLARAADLRRASEQARPREHRCAQADPR